MLTQQVEQFSRANNILPYNIEYILIQYKSDI